MAKIHAIALLFGGFTVLFLPLFMFFMWVGMWDIGVQLGVVVAWVILVRPISWAWYDAMSNSFKEDDDDE